MNLIQSIIQGYSNFEIIYGVGVLIINIVAFILMGMDKRRASKNEWRIQEASLFGIAAFGGAIGILIGMILWKHKTSKTKFYVGIPLLYIANKVTHLLLLKYFLGKLS